MTDKKRYILLEVSESKAKDLIDALTKRNYLRLINLDNIDDRRLFEACPVCDEDLSKEWHVTITETILEGCLSLLQKMETYKSIVLYHKSFLEEVRPIDAARSLKFHARQLFAAKLLGIIGHFKDGTQDTFYITDKGIRFMRGDVALSPCNLVVVNNKVITADGTMMIEETKRKDSIKFNNLLTNIRKAIDNLPIEVLNFVRSGQVSLL